MAQILDESDLANLNEALEMAEGVQEEILRAEQAGINVSAAKERIDATTKRIRLVKSTFFPQG